MFNKLVKLFGPGTDFDHYDVDQIKKLARERGLDELEVGKAFFVARDLKTLKEQEILEGGNGSEASKVNVEELRKSTFSKGEGKL